MHHRLIKNSTLVWALTGSLHLAACGAARTDATEDLSGVPELGAVEMSLTEDANAEGTSTEHDAVDPSTASADDLMLMDVPEENSASDLRQAQAGIRQLNQALRGFLRPIAALVRETEPTRQAGAVKQWGPITHGETEYRFLLRKATDGRHTWRLDARSAGSQDSFTRVAVGALAVGSKVRRGAGALGVDLDALGSVNPDVAARGEILVGFRHAKAGTTVSYGLRNFTHDPSTSDGIDAVLRAVHLKNGFNRVRLAYRGNLPETATDAPELILARLRHQRAVGGRSDLLVVGGDVPSGTSWVISQCWDRGQQDQFRVVRLCKSATDIDLSSCTIQSTSGDEHSCGASLGNAELPPIDPAAPAADAEDPNADVEIPDSLQALDNVTG
jgi:hypothetical protein